MARQVVVAKPVTTGKLWCRAQDIYDISRQSPSWLKLTLEEVNAAFRKMVNRDQLTVVLAGDQKKAMTQE